MTGFEGYAGASDPRESHGDLLEESKFEAHDAETYREYADMEAFRSGWVATGVVLDDAGRVLLAYDADDDVWLLPGGTLERDESLVDGLVREVCEETGVAVDPVRPHAVSEYRIENAAVDDEWTGFRVAFLEATATDATVGDDLGVDDEHITRADWFLDLPDVLFNDAFTRRLVDYVREE
ncbi:NUDIX domain-containing protein [Halorubellus sp. JP-L1]|uniref:NUDIX hydrolase n=1 Tax=Halorubellus sp. JP-L1 TaxID=2715753 RepID=UPI001409BE05|nr:NUDIX domain-containing protein [Halorubellus sp. JP-L1]NHN40635.1 NUDIX domain-containing protein [Halorubellus sp. JP-L1]